MKSRTKQVYMLINRSIKWKQQIIELQIYNLFKGIYSKKIFCNYQVLLHRINSNFIFSSYERNIFIFRLVVSHNIDQLELNIKHPTIWSTTRSFPSLDWKFSMSVVDVSYWITHKLNYYNQRYTFYIFEPYSCVLP